ncbi:unnamed protein product [Angiostrongylus costaricensis]|uniref:C2H2-type domain-containing protein n=1 Tax=Angiostrongylus costaricensis TaxID=334426 RepID=A0A158PLZ2_ANGCS|nr:unnamed protein product [Angiostrongylus costaricensis]
MVPLTYRTTRRKRCSCGCSGCDIFPGRACCSSECCSSAPLPLACCPPPPPPKPCCQPAYGPCCPATPNCCPNPCCRWDALSSQPPSNSNKQLQSYKLCRKDLSPYNFKCSDCGCARPCCYYQNPSCCNQGKPCCPPPLPCCPVIPLPTLNCLATVPPCLRACPKCPCRKRIMLGKRSKRHDALHCQPGIQQPPRAGRLYEQNRARRVKRGGCAICIDGRPIIKRSKRSLDCVRCTYLQPTVSANNPFAVQLPPMSPVGILPPHLRQKRAGCLPHPECMLAPRRVRRNIESQYCEPCSGGYYGRKKREVERDKCLRRDKRSTSAECEVDEFLVTRMKRQAYNPSGILDIVKVLSKTMASEAGPSGCVKFPACILAKRKRRKRHAERTEHYHKAKSLVPPLLLACVPCPAWVTLALASRKKRSTNSSNELEDDEDDDESPRRKQGTCDQTDDCLNEVEYAIFKKVYHNTRVKREIFRRRKCERCGSGSGGKRVKRNFGEPTINASEQSCIAFPQCRHRVKRNLLFQDCNICTPNINRKRKKRDLGLPQCYPCRGTMA